MGIVSNDKGEAKVLKQNHSLNNCQLIESGKYYNRRFLNDLTYEASATALDQLNSGIEIASWPDRLLFLFRSVPTEVLVQGMLEISLDLDEKYSIELTDSGGHALLAKDGSGYVLLPGFIRRPSKIDTGKCCSI